MLRAMEAPAYGSIADQSISERDCHPAVDSSPGTPEMKNRNESFCHHDDDQQEKDSGLQEVPEFHSSFPLLSLCFFDSANTILKNW